MAAGSLSSGGRRSRPGLRPGKPPCSLSRCWAYLRVVRIAELLNRGRPTVSFEFMAPRDESEVELLERTVATLSGHTPDWVSVTYRLRSGEKTLELVDRKSTRLNSSHRCISYAVFCL